MSLIVQLIDVEWTKKSRGAPNATLRNAVPNQYQLDPVNIGSGSYLHKIEYSEYSNFEKPMVKPLKSMNENQLREIQLSIESNGQSVDIYSWGIPLRKAYPKQKLVGQLTKGTWLRVTGNARVSWETTWAYHKYTYNIFFGDAIKFNEVIKNNKPVCEHRDEVQLW
mgnify:CR=1 FL=1